MSVNSKHSVSKNDKSGKRAKRKKFEDSEEIESSEEELDLTKECHPIGHYINDRAEMINQMFSVIRGNKLKAMLPPILKDCDLDLLKLKCLDQLLGMSDKRIACILDGEVLETSSESDVDSNDYESNEKQKSSSGTASDRSDESMEVEVKNEAGKRSRGKGKKKASMVEDGKSDKVSQNDSNPAGAEQGKTLLEILELEMRARAIRALLNQNENTSEGNSAEVKAADLKENGVKIMNDEVVDLTGCEDDDYPIVAKKDKTEELLEGKESVFEEKIEKAQSDKGNHEQEKEKTKRMQAELELRNKLFKKKIYRTRQQRMENEDDRMSSKETESGAHLVNPILQVSDFAVKEESVQKVVKPAEDPEEGELSSSEDETSSEIKEKTKSNSPAKEPDKPDPKYDVVMETPSITTAGNGGAHTKPFTLNEDSRQSVNSDSAGPNKQGNEADLCDERECLNVEGEDDVLNIDSQEVAASLHEESLETNSSGETSWRERWLRKDGVQKLVKSSKIYAKVKKRIAEKSQRSKEELNSPSETKQNVQSSEKMEIIEGSIKEYEKLIGKTVQSLDNSNNVPNQDKCAETDALTSRDNNTSLNDTADSIAQNV